MSANSSTRSDLPPISPAIIIDDDDSTKSSQQNQEKENVKESVAWVVGTNNNNNTKSHQKQHQQTSELERLLVDQIAANHLKDDEILALERSLRKTQEELEDQRDLASKFKDEMSLLGESLNKERRVRKELEANWKDLKAKSSSDADELSRVEKELSTVALRKVPGENITTTSQQTATLIRAFMSLQLDVIRAFGWCSARLVEDWKQSVHHAVIEPEKEEFRLIFLQFESESRRISENQECEIRHNKIYQERKAIELRIVSSLSMVAEHSRLFGKLSVEYCSKAQTDWITCSSLYTEYQRKTAAMKLRQVAAKLKKVTEESEEKSKQIEEAKRNYNLLKARFDVRTKEQAAKQQQKSNLDSSAISESDKIGKNSTNSSRVITSPKYSVPRKPSTLLKRPASAGPVSTTTTMATSRTHVVTIDVEKNNEEEFPDFETILNSVISKPKETKPARKEFVFPTDHQQQQQGNTTPPPASANKRVWQTPPPPPPVQQQQHVNDSQTFLESTAKPVNTANSSRRNSGATIGVESSISQQQFVINTPLPNQHQSAQTQAAHSLYNDIASMLGNLEESVHHKEFVTKVSEEMTSLRKHLGFLEELIIKKDEKLNRVIEERNSLNKECDTIASQCRLLEQACRFGARKAAQESADMKVMMMMSKK